MISRIGERISSYRRIQNNSSASRSQTHNQAPNVHGGLALQNSTGNQIL